MSLPHYEPFYLHTLDELRAEIGRLGVEIPLSEELGVLAQAPDPETRIANRFCAQPITGLDAGEDGSPGRLTRRRYRRLAAGGFGVIWMEATVIGEAAPPGRLRIGEDNVAVFAEFVEELRQVARGEVTLVLQVAGGQRGGQGGPWSQPGRFADLIRAAGFDGVDVQAGGGIIPEVDAGLMRASRLIAYNAMEGADGIGTDASDYRREDLRMVEAMVRDHHRNGLGLLNVTCASPRLGGPAVERRRHSIPDHGAPDEHPLQVLERQLRIAGRLRAVAPGLPVVGSGFSWLRHLLPYVAAGAVESGMIDLVGLGRSALACPDAPSRIMEGDGLDLGTTCMVCFACNELLDGGGPVGCPIRDPGTYGVEPVPVRRVEPGDLATEADRCHRCEAAPCVAANRTGTDIPAMIDAWCRGDERNAYEILRRSDVLPEMTAELTPGWLHSEGACIETALTGRPVPILDLQHVIAWRAREAGETGVRLPEEASGCVVAIVGGGPAGVAAAARLLEYGHAVDLYEASHGLGGTPERVIPASRFQSPETEIDALLAPGLGAGRLRVHLGRALGVELELDVLCAAADAVLLAAGVWQERTVADERVDGVVDGLGFLESAKQGGLTRVPGRVAILAGGDCAMDVAREAERLGARDLFVIYSGTRTEMHWHMGGDWFGEPGHHALMECEPTGYAMEGEARCELRIRENGEERVLEVGMVIEAMGLEVANDLRAALPGVEFNRHGLVACTDGARTTRPGVFAAGGLVNGGASVARCIAEGLAAAEEIHGAFGAWSAPAK